RPIQEAVGSHTQFRPGRGTNDPLSEADDQTLERTPCTCFLKVLAGVLRVTPSSRTASRWPTPPESPLSATPRTVTREACSSPPPSGVPSSTPSSRTHSDQERKPSATDVAEGFHVLVPRPCYPDLWP